MLVLLVMSLVWVPGATAGDWPTVRGANDNRGMALDNAVGIDRLAWRVKTGGDPGGEPVACNGLLFSCTVDRRVEVFDVRTGRRVFRERLGGPITGVVADDTTFGFVADQGELRYFRYRVRPFRRLQSFRIFPCATAPRWVSDSLVLLAGYDGTVSLVTGTGAEVWSADTEGPVLSSPAVVDTVVYVSSGRQVSALALHDGRFLWSHRAVGAVSAAPAVDDRVYVGAADSILYALDRDNGSMDWFFAVDGSIATTPAVSASRLYFGANDGFIYALDKSNGALLWRYDTGAIANLPPAIAGDVVIVATRAKRLLALDAATGALLQEQTLQSAATTAPVIASNRVFVADTRRHLYCFEAADSNQTARR